MNILNFNLMSTIFSELSPDYDLPLFDPPRGPNDKGRGAESDAANVTMVTDVYSATEDGILSVLVGSSIR